MILQVREEALLGLIKSHSDSIASLSGACILNKKAVDTLQTLYDTNVFLLNATTNGQAQRVTVGTTFGLATNSVANLPIFDFTQGSILRYENILPLNYTDPFAVVNYATLVNYVANTIYSTSGSVGGVTFPTLVPYDFLQINSDGTELICVNIEPQLPPIPDLTTSLDLVRVNATGTAYELVSASSVVMTGLSTYQLPIIFPRQIAGGNINIGYDSYGGNALCGFFTAPNGSTNTVQFQELAGTGPCTYSLEADDLTGTGCTIDLSSTGLLTITFPSTMDLHLHAVIFITNNSTGLFDACVLDGTIIGTVSSAPPIIYG